jgi:hypothetical protein
MKTFYCDVCGALVFFENVQCLKCDHALGFLPDVLDLSALEPESNDTWRALSPSAPGKAYRNCTNGREHEVCNWLVPIEDPEPFCASCRLNDVIPDLSDAHNRHRWFKLEQAKRRLVYTLFRLGLPTDSASDQGRPALRFRFLAGSAESPVTTGHSHGLITLDIAEADDAERERRRVNLHEPYRTVLGHLRHEVGHYYWDRLVAGTPLASRFREVFGDETQDYVSALQTHYAQGAPANWQARYVSAYASAHPWEDWAETWAHYLHIVDTIETAASFGLRLRPHHPNAPLMKAEPEAAAGPDAEFERMLEHWLPLTYALNSLNRGMGLPDLYPFVLSGVAAEKLRFIHDTVRMSAPR